MTKERFENIKQKYYLGYRSSLSLEAKKYIPKDFIMVGLNESESKLIWKRRIMNIIMNNDYDTAMTKLQNVKETPIATTIIYHKNHYTGEIDKMKLENSEETTESDKQCDSCSKVKPLTVKGLCQECSKYW